MKEIKRNGLGKEEWADLAPKQKENMSSLGNFDPRSFGWTRGKQAT
jgi:hypothetical protein